MLHPQGVRGPWNAGIVLDWHTVASQVIGENEFGQPIFETRRSQLGELLYRFKYRNDRTALSEMLRVCNQYLARRVTGKFEIVVPVPPSNAARIVTKCIAQGIAAGLGVTYSATALTKVKSTSALKSVIDPEVRKAMLRDAFQVDMKQIEGKATLLIDDVYRSGATLESAAEAVVGQGRPKAIYVLALTRTRVHR
jgi:predicted amidophosphoribosyltransferase